MSEIPGLSIFSMASRRWALIPSLSIRRRIRRTLNVFIMCREIAKETGAIIEMNADPMDAVKDADVIAVLVAHKEFKALSSAEVRSLFVTCPEEETPLLFDVKSIYDPKEIRGEGLAYWNL